MTGRAALAAVTVPLLAIAVAGCTSHHVARDVTTSSSTVAPTRTPHSIRAIRAARPGTLPESGTPSVNGIVMPAGSRIPVAKAADRSAVIWVSKQRDPHAGELAAELMAVFPHTGLWPLVLQDEDTGSGEPWLTGDFDRTHLTSLAGNPTQAFQEWWAQNIAHEDTDNADVAHDFGKRFRGLGAPAGSVDDDAVASVVANLPGRLGLVAVARPADVPATIGWLGATNYLGGGELSIALRSWEDRYGAELIRMGSDYAELAVRNPPRTHQEAVVAAAEHFAVCPDVISQNDDGYSPTEYADSLIGASEWYCWWD
jgi:hypothetical protein